VYFEIRWKYNTCRRIPDESEVKMSRQGGSKVEAARQARVKSRRQVLVAALLVDLILRVAGCARRV